MSNYEPKAGETAVTRGGRKAHVLAIRTDLPEERLWSVVGYIEGDVIPVCWQRDGRSSTMTEHHADLVGPWVDPWVDPCTDKFPQWGVIKITRHNDGSFSASFQFFATENEAAEAAMICKGSTFGPVNATDSFPVAPDCG